VQVLVKLMEVFRVYQKKWKVNKVSEVKLNTGKSTLNLIIIHHYSATS
jgi:hypothetical protein